MRKEDITPEIRDYLDQNWPLPHTLHENYGPRMDIRKGFILGAIWQKEQLQPNLLKSQELTYYLEESLRQIEYAQVILTGRPFPTILTTKIKSILINANDTNSTS